MQLRDVPAHFTHTGIQFGWRQFALEHRQHQIEQYAISLGENLFGLRGQSVERMWLSEPWLDSRLLNETVAFQTEEMSANRVVGKLERGCKFIHRLFARPQLLKNLPARTFEHSLSPTSDLHFKTVRSAASKSKPERRPAVALAAVYDRRNFCFNTLMFFHRDRKSTR